MRRGFVRVDDRRDDVALSVPLREEAGALGKEFLLFLQRKVLEERAVRARDEGAHQHGILAYLCRQVKSLDLIVDKLRVAPLPFDNVVVASCARFVNLGIARLVGFISLILLFDGRNVRLVILFHVTN